MNRSPAAAVPSARAAPDPRVRPFAASLVRRMAAFLYEGVLCFGIVVAVALAYDVAVHQTSGIEHRGGLIASCFVALGIYFIYLWVRSGQTLAQKTWHLRVVATDGASLSPRRALARYLAAWLWFLPPLALAGALDIRSAAFDFGLLGAWVAAYALSARLHPRHQFWHDALCGTALVDARPAAPMPH
ncbi:MAG: RDD family protein [Burkholderiaceae bacterium]